VTYGATTKQTRSVQRSGNHVEWNDNLDLDVLWENLLFLFLFVAEVSSSAVRPHSHITVSLYAERTKPNPTPIGSQRIACEPPRGSSHGFWNSYSCFWLSTRYVEHDIVFDSADGHPRQTKEPATVLTITVSSNASSSRTATDNTPNLRMDNPVAEGGGTRSIVQSDTEAAGIAAGTAPTSHLSRTADDTLIERGTSVSGGTVAASQTGMSRPPDLAEEAIDTMKTWRSVVNVMKQVMDTVSPVVVKEVCPIPSFSTIHRANCCPSACQLSMEFALQYPRGMHPCLVPFCEDMEHSLFFSGSLAGYCTPITA
jgi:hypothetical protein